MARFVPLAAIAGALACVVAAGSAQAAPASANILGKLTTVSDTSGVAVEKVHFRKKHHHHRWHRKYWKKRYYKSHRHHHHRKHHHRHYKKRWH